MITSVWKLRPTNMWKIPEIEQWLSDMAKEGLHLHKMGMQFGKFKRGEAQDLLYRIDISNDAAPSEEDLKKYKLAGWKYATKFNDFHIYVARENKQPQPFPINYEKQLAVIKKKKIYNLLSLSVSLLLIIISIWVINAYASDIPVILRMIEGDPNFQPLLITPFILNSFSDVVQFTLMSKYQKQLLDDSTTHPYVEWRWHIPRRIFGFILYPTIVLGAILIPALQIWKMDYTTLSIEETQSYVVRLPSIEQPEGLKISNESYDYTVTSYWSILATKYYDVNEGFYTYGSDLITKPRIYSKVFELRFSFLAEPLLLDLIKDTSSFENPMKLKEMSHKQFDLLYVLEQHNYVKIYAAKDSIVTYVIHFGNPNTDILIEELASKFNE